MDTLTHTLVGLTLSRFDFARDLGPVAAVTLTVSSLLPDADVISHAFGSTSYIKHHRGITHGLAVLPFEAALLAGGLVMFWPTAGGVGFTKIFLLSLMAMVVHILFDILTPYGTQVLLPFHHHPVTTDSMPVFEPFMILLTGAGLFFSYTHPAMAHQLAMWILLLWAAFFAFYGASKIKADVLLRRFGGKGILESDTFPVPGMPLVWLCVIKRRTLYETFSVNVLTNRMKRKHLFKPHPFPRQLEDRRLTHVFKRFARHFLVERRVENGNFIYTIRDLRFDFPYKRRFFTWEIEMDRRGNILNERFRL